MSWLGLSLLGLLVAKSALLYDKYPSVCSSPLLENMILVLPPEVFY